MQVNGRDITFDIMRGVGMILVILGHLAHGFGVYIVPVIYTFHMPFFFILSGYFYKSKNSITLLKRDMRSLIVPYIIVSIIVLLYGFIISILKDDYSNFKYWYDATIKMEDIGPLWFLLALFWCRQIYNFIYNRIKLNTNTKHSLLILIGFVFYCFIPCINNFCSFNLLCILNGFHALFYYSLGNILRERNILQRIKLNGITLIILILVFVISMYYSLYGVDMGILKQNNIIMNIMVSLSSFWIIYYICNMFNRIHVVGKYIAKYGQLSIVIYTVHTIMLRIVPFEKFILIISPGLDIQIRSIIIVVLHLIITYYFCLYAEKNKVCQSLFNIK